MVRHSKDVELSAGVENDDLEDGPCPGCKGECGGAKDGALRRLWVPRPLTMHAGPAAPCGKAGNPKCGDPKKRAAGLIQLVKDIDALALTFGAKHSILDGAGKMTILDTTDTATNRKRLEHAAGILIDAKGVPRFTRVLYGDLDSVDIQPAFDKDLKAGDKVVGVIHSHPGSKPGDGGEHFSQEDIKVARKFATDNKSVLHKDVGALFYVLTSKQNGGKVLVFDVRRDTITVVG